MANSPEQNKLERVLHHFIDSSYRRGSSDGIYMEKLLSHLSGEDNGDINFLLLSLWLKDGKLTFYLYYRKQQLSRRSSSMQGMDTEDGRNMEEQYPRTVFGCLCFTFHGVGC